MKIELLPVSGATSADAAQGTDGADAEASSLFALLLASLFPSPTAPSGTPDPTVSPGTDDADGQSGDAAPADAALGAVVATTPGVATQTVVGLTSTPTTPMTAAVENGEPAADESVAVTPAPSTAAEATTESAAPPVTADLSETVAQPLTPAAHKPSAPANERRVDDLPDVTVDAISDGDPAPRPNPEAVAHAAAPSRVAQDAAAPAEVSAPAAPITTPAAPVHATPAAHTDTSALTTAVSTVTAVKSAAPAQVDATPATQAAPTPQPVEQIIVHIRPLVARGHGRHEIEVQLHPAELGSVNVRLEVDDSTVHVHLHAQHADAARLLDEALPELRRAIDALGLSAGDLSVAGDSGNPRPDANDHLPQSDGSSSSSTDANSSTTTAPRGSLSTSAVDLLL